MTVPGKNGNKREHDPRNPVFPGLLSKSQPRILHWALEEIRKWYKKSPLDPDAKKPSPLLFPRKIRGMRSERREAILCLLEAILHRLELHSRYVGTPNYRQKPYGFIDESMAGLAKLAGLEKRRCERAMRELMQAGLITSQRRSAKHPDGSYYGLRAIRKVQEKLFAVLELMSDRPWTSWFGIEAVKARDRLWEKAQKRGLNSLKKFFRRLGVGGQEKPREPVPQADDDMVNRWNHEVEEIFRREPDKPPEQVRLEVNEKFGLSADYSPGAKKKK
jgi:hypothetical protein